VLFREGLLRQVLRDLIDNCLEHFAPILVYRSIEFQAADSGLFPRFFDCGRVNTELEYTHGLLSSCWQRSRVFRLKFLLNDGGEVSNLSFRGGAARFLFEQPKVLKTLTLDRLEPLNGFTVIHKVVFVTSVSRITRHSLRYERVPRAGLFRCHRLDASDLQGKLESRPDNIYKAMRGLILGVLQRFTRDVFRFEAPILRKYGYHCRVRSRSPMNTNRTRLNRTSPSET
jgi:hypothetical protein